MTATPLEPTPRHLALPIKVTAAGALATVEQDSDADIAQSVALVIDTRPGERRSVPDYGVPDPVFGGVDAPEIANVVLAWEDRAERTLVERVAAGVVEQAQVHAETPAPRDYEITSAGEL